MLRSQRLLFALAGALALPVSAQGTVTVGAGTLTVANGSTLRTPLDLTVASGATLTATEGALAFSSTTDQAFTTPAAPQVVRDLRMETSGAVVLGMDLRVTGVLTAAGGTLSPNGHTATLGATVTGSTVTRLAALAGDGSSAGGPFVYERPFVDGGGWRLIASPFATAFTDLDDDFHTQGAAHTDYAGGNPILFGWDAAQPDGSRYQAVADYASAFEAGRGYAYYAFATGPDGMTTYLPGTWDVTGVEPAAPAVALAYASGDAEAPWNLLGNPYAAPLDWHAVQAAGSFAASYAVWDPGAGAYAYYSTSGASTGDAGRYIAPGQGFWAEATASSPATLAFDRSWKAPASSPVVVGRQRGGAEVAATLRFHVEGQGLAGTDPVALFLDGGEAGADAYDARWLVPLASEFVAARFVRADGARLVFDGRPAEAAGQELALDVEATAPGRYVLTWPELEAAPEGALSLRDARTGAVVDLRTASSYAFDVDEASTARQASSLAASAPAEKTGASGAARFTVLLGTSAVGAEEEGVGPEALALDAPFPNPATGLSTVGFSMPEAGRARLEVVDVLGRSVAVVADASYGAGRQRVDVDVSSLPAGTYLVRLEAAGGVRSRSLTVVR